jgi:hypothetical protein
MAISIFNVEQWAGRPLPETYRALLPTFRDAIIGRQVLLYPLDYVIERNETLETKVYCPGYIAIGDDSGGRAFVISLNDPECNLFVVDHGSMDPDDFGPLNTTLGPWLEAKCPVT